MPDDPNVWKVLTALAFAHLFFMLIASTLVGEPASRARRGRAVVVAIGLAPLVLFGTCLAFPPDPGADGLGGFWPGVLVMLGVPASWIGLLVVIVRARRARREQDEAT